MRFSSTAHNHGRMTPGLFDSFEVCERTSIIAFLLTQLIPWLLPRWDVPNDLDLDRTVLEKQHWALRDPCHSIDGISWRGLSMIEWLCEAQDECCSIWDERKYCRRSRTFYSGPETNQNNALWNCRSLWCYERRVFGNLALGHELCAAIDRALVFRGPNFASNLALLRMLHQKKETPTEMRGRQALRRNISPSKCIWVVLFKLKGLDVLSRWYPKSEWQSL